MKIKYEHSFDSLDVIFVGNSYCYSGIIPNVIEEAGLTTYNLGIATSGPIFYELVLNDYLHSVHVYPRMVCMLVSPTTFSRLSDNFEKYPINRYLNTPVRNETIALKYGLLLKYPGMLKTSIEKSFENTLEPKHTKNDSTMYFSQGYVKNTTLVSQEVIDSIEPFYSVLMNDHFDEVKYNDLVAYAKELEVQNMEVVFFTLPTYKLKNYFSNDFLETYKMRLNELRSDFNFIPLEVYLDSSHFKNIDHLNYKGARIVSEMMRDTLKKMPF